MFVENYPQALVTTDGRLAPGCNEDLVGYQALSIPAKQRADLDSQANGLNPALPSAPAQREKIKETNAAGRRLQS